jgi:hypothetical protein
LLLHSIQLRESRVGEGSVFRVERLDRDLDGFFLFNCRVLLLYKASRKQRSSVTASLETKRANGRRADFGFGFRRFWRRRDSCCCVLLDVLHALTPHPVNLLLGLDEICQRLLLLFSSEVELGLKHLDRRLKGSTLYN